MTERASTRSRINLRRSRMATGSADRKTGSSLRFVPVGKAEVRDQPSERRRLAVDMHRSANAIRSSDQFPFPWRAISFGRVPATEQIPQVLQQDDSVLVRQVGESQIPSASSSNARPARRSRPSMTFESSTSPLTRPPMVASVSYVRPLSHVSIGRRHVPSATGGIGRCGKPDASRGQLCTEHSIRTRSMH